MTSEADKEKEKEKEEEQEEEQQQEEEEEEGERESRHGEVVYGVCCMGWCMVRWVVWCTSEGHLR